MKYWDLTPTTPPLPIGTIVRPWGKVAAVLSLAGPPRERYYHLIDKDGSVAMMPAVDVERMAEEQS